MYNFTKAEKGTYGGATALPEDIVRVSAKNISFGVLAASHFPFTLTEGGNKVTNVSVEYDEVNQALRIKPDPQGWRAWAGPTGTMNMHKTGKTIAELNILMGDYVPHETEPHVYVLAK